MRRVLDGAAFLSHALRQNIREQLGDSLVESLVQTGAAHRIELRTNLSDEDLKAWFAILGPAVRAQGE